MSTKFDAPVVTVYTKTQCSQCDLTKKWLENNNIPYNVDYATDPDNFKAITELGYKSAPVVLVSANGAGSEVHWTGFRPDLLAENLLPS